MHAQSDCGDHMSNQFQEYVTGQAFALTLSRRMCEALEYLMFMSVHVEGYRAVTIVPNIPTLNALKERGLVDLPPRLTEAGRLMYPVLAHAGLVTPEAEIRKRLGVAA